MYIFVNAARRCRVAPSVRVNDELIRQIREKRGWERREFASLVGISADRVYKTEKLKQIARPLTLRRTVAVLGVPPQDFTRDEVVA